MATLESINARIAKLQAQAESLVSKKSTVVLEKIRELMEKHGIGVSDIEAHVGKRRGRKPGAVAATKKGASVAKYRDPKSGATWTGHGRAPAWIANARDRSRFLVDGAASSAVVLAKAAKAGNYVRGPQPAMYRDPKSGATWSGRGRAPAWLASAKDRSKFLIAGAAETAATPKAKAAKAVAAKKSVARKSTLSKKALTKRAATKTVVAQARKAARKNGATTTAPAARKARLSKSAANTAGTVDVGVNRVPTEVASPPAAA